MLRRFYVPGLLLTAAAIASGGGCGKSESNHEHKDGGEHKHTSQTDSPAKPPAVASPASPEAHAHKPGAHGGILVSLGRDNYHVEAIFGKEGVLRLYTLGQDEDRIQEVENQELVGYVKAAGGTESTSFEIKPEPQAGDPPGKTSQFVGHLPQEFWGQNLEVTVPNITISGERFRLNFSSVTQPHGDEAMPSKVSNEEERELYLTPGGSYTAADIVANGNVTASQKFKGFMSAHDMHPKPGDKICPVTLTKANAKCAWIVGGQKYEFCCPPCVDEFVKLAKTDQEKVKEPGAYIQR